MKKKFIFILLFMFSFLLVSCDNNKEKEEFAVLKIPFSVDNNISNNNIYQQNSKLKITGKCIKNGKIIATLFDENEVAVASSFGIGDDNGQYEIIINTPKGSFTQYSLILHDSNNKFQSSFDGLIFGEVSLLLGDEIINDPLSNNLSENTLDSLEDNLFILDTTKANSTWETKFVSNDISEFIYNYYNLLKKTSNFKNMPIAFVKVVFNKTDIIEWLPQEEVKNNSEIYQYLVNNNKYLENSYEIGQMSYVSNLFLSSLYNYSFGTIIYSAGVNDFISYSKQENNLSSYNIYSKLLLMCLKNIYNNIFSFNSFSILQAPSCDVENIELLRNIQAKVSKYIKNANFIPIYDINENDQLAFSKQVLERYYQIVNGKKRITDVGNVIKKYDGSNLSKIIIEFSNTSKLDFNLDSIKVLDIHNEIITLEDDKIIIDDNSITIDLSYYEASFENSDDLELQYYLISSVSYAYESIFDGDVILNDSNIPILPFLISIDSQNEVKSND